MGHTLHHQGANYDEELLHSEREHDRRQQADDRRRQAHGRERDEPDA
jgi:hypothetical protein